MRNDITPSGTQQSVLGLPEPTTSVLFAESPLHPGVPIVYRTPEEKSPNPDRLNLDRRHLSVCPILEGEEKLRLLNLQHNSITRSPTQVTNCCTVEPLYKDTP